MSDTALSGFEEKERDQATVDLFDLGEAGYTVYRPKDLDSTHSRGSSTVTARSGFMTLACPRAVTGRTHMSSSSTTTEAGTTSRRPPRPAAPTRRKTGPNSSAEPASATNVRTEVGLPVITDAEAIARFLRKRGERVVFATYESSPQIAGAQVSRVPAFDLVIADEAHRCAGPQTGVFATVLDAKRIRAQKRLFTTATPKYFTGRVKKEAKEADWEVASMDEEENFGGVLHRLSFAHAIEQKLLSDYRVIVVGVSDRENRDSAKRGNFVSRDGQSNTDARTLAREIGLLRSMAKYDLSRVVTFHSRIHMANRFASSLPETKAWLPPRRPSETLWTEPERPWCTLPDRSSHEGVPDSGMRVRFEPRISG
jgi:hypothetical protein